MHELDGGLGLLRQVAAAAVGGGPLQGARTGRAGQVGRQTGRRAGRRKSAKGWMQCVECLAPLAKLPEAACVARWPRLQQLQRQPHKEVVFPLGAVPVRPAGFYVIQQHVVVLPAAIAVACTQKSTNERK